MNIFFIFDHILVLAGAGAGAVFLNQFSRFHFEQVEAVFEDFLLLNNPKIVNKINPAAVNPFIGFGAFATFVMVLLILSETSLKPPKVFETPIFD